jgi:hypothetical protein
MNIAVLISGEYRTFKHTRPSMTFLDDPRVDVYVSTWDTTRYVIPKLEIDITVPVTEAEIRLALNTRAVIDIRPSEPFEFTKFNCRMIDRWLRGKYMIESSGVQYDYIIIVRPDIFFTQPIILDDITKCSNSLATVWENRQDFLQDVLLIAKTPIMLAVLNSITVEEWANTPEFENCHRWWWRKVNALTTSMIAPGGFNNSMFWRPLCQSPEMLTETMIDWVDLHLIYVHDSFGMTAATMNWSKEYVENALTKWHAGYFDRYKQWRP